MASLKDARNLDDPKAKAGRVQLYTSVNGTDVVYGEPIVGNLGHIIGEIIRLAHPSGSSSDIKTAILKSAWQKNTEWIGGRLVGIRVIEIK